MMKDARSLETSKFWKIKFTTFKISNPDSLGVNLELSCQFLTLFSDIIILTSLKLYLVTLTEYGFCIADRTVRNEFHRDQEGHIHGTNMTSNKVLAQGF